MKKSTMRVLSLVMALMMIVGTLAVVPFSAIAYEEHVHTKGEVIRVQEPTCNLYGYTVYACAECGKSYADDVTEKLAHNYQEVGAKPATCDEDGYTAGVRCTVCGDVLEGCEPITSDGVHAIAYRIVDNADCLDGVVYEMYCADCGRSLGITDTIVAGRDHNLVAEIITEPTCTEKGEAKVYCLGEGAYYFDDCAFEAEVEIESLGHVYVERWTEDGNPFYHYKECSRCGEIISLDEEEVPCEHVWVSNGYSFAYVGNAQLSSKNFDGTAEEYITEYAKYSDISDLYEIFACKYCNEQKLEKKFEKIGHVYGTYTFKFNGKVITAAGTETLGTIERDNDGEIINVTYYEVVLEGGHIDREYRCEEPVVKTSYCAICAAREGQTYEGVVEELNVQEHNYDGWICQNEGCSKNATFVVGGETYYECTNCMHLHAENVCLNKKGIERETAGYVVTIFVDYETEGYIAGDESADDFDIEKGAADEENAGIPAAYGEMEYCFYENVPELDTIGKHEVENVVRTQPGTCVDRAYTYSYCLNPHCTTKCDVEYGAIDPDNHTFGEWFTVTEATCFTEGLERRVCANGCGKIEQRTTAINAEAHPDEEFTWELVKDENGDAVVMPATCIAPAQNVLACRFCGVTKLENVEGSEPLPKDVLESHYAKDEDQYNHKNINAVNRSVATCVEGGTKAYEYCTLCDTIITIEGKDVFEEMMTQYVYDEETEEWVLNPELLIDALGHDLVVEEGEAANCFKAGKNPLVKCARCGKIFTVAEAKELDEVDLDLEELDDEFVLNGAIIPATLHDIKEIELAEGDVAVTREVYLYVDDEDYQAKEFALRIRARLNEEGNPDIQEVIKFNVDTGEETRGYRYFIDYVEPTCTAEGYIVGKYCENCMKAYGTGNDKTYFDGVFGYKLDMVEHNYAEPVVVELPAIDEECGGKVFYAYTIRFCRDCELVKVEGYDKAVAKDHKAETYPRTIGDVKKGDPIIYTVVFNGEELVEFDARLYPDCTYATFTAKKCAFCGEFYEVEDKDAAKGHYAADGTPIDITCTGYNAAYVGAKCVACGYKVPEYVVRDITEGDFKGLQEELYFTDGHVAIAEEAVNEYGYFTIEHDWAETLDCEKTIIKECSICGIKVLNDRFKANGYHEYILREGGIESFDLEAYDEYAFDNVVYPTATKEGFGTLTCVKCRQVLEVTIPATTAELSASYDDVKTVIVGGEEAYAEYVTEVLVGDEVTVTVRISAKDFAFNELKLIIVNIPNVFEIKSAEILYNFDTVDDVRAYINAEGDVILRTPGIANRNVTVSGEDVPFVKLTFKTGDLTLAQETTRIDFARIEGYEVICLDEEGNIDDAAAGEIGLANAAFGILEIYNPNYTRSAVTVLAQIYKNDYADKFDFNADGTVDLDDYFAMVDYVDSAKTIADFCTLVGYDVEAMLDGLDYSRYTSRKSIVNDPTQIDWTYGEANDIAYGKNVVRRELAKANYQDSIIEAWTTIADFAQTIIDANTL